MWKTRVVNGISLSPSRIAAVRGRAAGDGVYDLQAGAEGPARGVASDAVIQPERLRESLGEVLGEVMGNDRRLGGHTIVSLDAGCCKVTRTRAKVSLDTSAREPFYEALSNTFALTADAQLQPERTVLHVFPQSAKLIDHKPGQPAVVQVEAIIVSAPSQLVSGIDSAIRTFGTRQVSFCATPLATGEFLLSPDERAGQVALVMMTEHSTAVQVYERGNLRAASYDRQACDLLVSDLGYMLQMPLPVARDIFQQHGTFDPHCETLEESTVVPTLDGGGQRRVSLRVIQDIITARMRELAEQVVFRLDKADVASSSTVILTGSGLETPGAQAFVGRILERPVQAGSMPEIDGKADLLHSKGIQAATAAAGQHQDLRETIEPPTLELAAG